MAIELQEVKSSMFSKVGYDENEWVLVVEYRSSSLRLAYQGISPELYEEMMAAESIGKYFNAHIKGKFEAVGDELAAPVTKKAPAESAISDDDIRAAEPGWDGEKINFEPLDPLPQSDRPSEVTVTKEVTRNEVSQAYGEEVALSAFPEVLPAWEPPKNPVEAIMGLQSRESEIAAIIAQNTQQGKDALAIRVTDKLSHAGAGQLLTELVNAKDRTFGLLDPFRKILYETYKFAGDRCKSALDPLEQAITHVKRTMGAWEQEQERIRQQRLREERERAEAAARELQKKQSEQLTLAEMQDAIEVGDTARAEELVQKPIEVPMPYVAPVAVEPTYLPPEGQSVRANWKCDEESANMTEFLMAVKAGKIEIAQAARFVKFDFSSLNKIAKSLQDAFSVPGVRAFNDPVRSVRRGK